MPTKTRALRWPSATLLFVSAAVCAKVPPGAAPIRAYFGNATPEPPLWSGQPARAISVGFGTDGPAPTRGSIVTLVPMSASLPVIRSSVTSHERDDHDGDTAIHVQAVPNPEWVRGSWSEGGVWSNPRVMVILGRITGARVISKADLALAELPTGTLPQDVRMAVDLDGDHRAEIVARYACKNGRRDCEEFGCEEVWVRAARSWERQDQTCSD
jgi:hypothetical protein